MKGAGRLAKFVLPWNIRLAREAGSRGPGSAFFAIQYEVFLPLEGMAKFNGLTGNGVVILNPTPVNGLPSVFSVGFPHHPVRSSSRGALVESLHIAAGRYIAIYNARPIVFFTMNYALVCGH